MKLYYVAHARMPTEKAHGAAIARMCEAFAKEGAQVTLVVPKRATPFAKDLFDTYGVGRTFAVRFLPVVDLLRVWGTRSAFYLQLATFYSGITVFFLFKPRRGTVVFTREAGAIFLAFLGFRVSYESHDGPPHAHAWLYFFLCRRAYTIVATTPSIKRAFLEQGFPERRILVAPNAVDVDFFSVRESKKDIRIQLGIPPDARVCVYTGHLYARKGTGTLARAAVDLPKDILVYVVGGTAIDVEAFRREWARVPNLRIVGHRPFAEMPLWQSAADVLVLPNSAADPVSRSFTSPLKLFEYMTSSRPIVASDVPSAREVLSEKNAVLIPPDDPNALARAILQLLNDAKHSEKLAAQARLDVAEQTWENRARLILQALGGA